MKNSRPTSDRSGTELEKTDLSVLLLKHPSDQVRICAGEGMAVRAIEAQDGHLWLAAALHEVDRAVCSGCEALIVALPANVRPAEAAVRELLGHGADDVVEAGEPRLIPTLTQALIRTKEILSRCRAIETKGGLWGRSPGIRMARKQLARALDDSDCPVLLLGETGVGKFLAARALHTLDHRRSGGPFHAVDCGSIVDTLFGSELFGHVQGSFTGANTNRRGAIASAGTGTLMLDEIGELSPALQASFLTALQERQYRPVGSDQEYPIRCRFVAATNRDLPALVTAGKFRPDLFYRLDGVRVLLPPLRRRREDIPLLFRRLLSKHWGRPEDEVETDHKVMDLVCAAPLRGNVRELEAIARYCVLAAGRSGRIRLAHLPIAILSDGEPMAARYAPSVPEMVETGFDMDAILSSCARQAVQSVLDSVRAAEPLGKKTAQVSQVAMRLRISPRMVYKVLGAREPRGEGPLAACA